MLVSMYTVDNNILWEKLDPSNLPHDLIGLRDGKLVWTLPGGVDMQTFSREVSNTPTTDCVGAVKRPNLLRRLASDNDSVFGAVIRGAVKTLLLRPVLAISRWCHGILNY